ncbi:MAG: PKD domain-containing protein, partial [Candidatus Andersenbacteria bacterium]
MTQRSRNVLIIVFLAVLIAGGAIGIYFVSRVQTSLVLPSGQMAKDVEGRDTVIPLSLAQQLLPGGDTDIDWLSGCSLNGFDPTNRSNWEAKKGGQITINFTCTNTDPSTAHKLEVRAFDLRAYVYQLPPNEACLDQGDKGQFQEWPKVPSDPGYYNWNTLQLWVGNWAQANGADCSGLPAGKSNIQELGWPDSPDSKQTIDVPAGQTAINFTTTHNFSECDWYQYDVLLLDALNQDHEFGVGSFRRSYGDQIQCGIVGPTNEASLEVRAYMDDNHDFEYGPQTSEGAPFFQKKIKITDTATGQEIDYAAEDCGGVQDTNQLGGAGRTICPKLDAGKTYTVELVDLLPNTTGPIKETHNTNGINPVDITLVGDPAKDIVDFGFQPGLQGVGSLLVRVYEEKTPADDEYTNNSGEGAVFANTPVTITDSTGKRINPVTPPNPNCPAVTGGAGRISCTGLTAGNYTIDVDPDITTHDGPDPEAHNPQGEDPYTVAVTVNKETIADFQYLPRIVNPQLSCTLGAQPSQGMIPLNVTFTATVQPAGTTVQKYDWVFGDGQTASGTQNTQQHTYTQQGNYTASVTLTTQAGETVSCTTIIQAKLVQPQGVNCTLAANPSSGISPLDTTLTVTVAPAGTTVTSYTFEFGDGSQAVTQTGASIQHTYTGKNTYTAKATVNDSTGAIATCTTPVEVDQIVQPGFCQID